MNETQESPLKTELKRNLPADPSFYFTKMKNYCEFLLVCENKK